MNKDFKKISFSFFNHLSLQDKELFVKRLAYLLKAGVPILQSLTMLLEQTRSKVQKEIIQSLMGDIDNGQTLHFALSRFKKVFGGFIINVIRVGEKTGTLPQNLNYLADELKKRRILRKKIIGSLVYPIFIAIATILITVLLIIFIFPKILPILYSLNIPLPITTRILIFLSNFLKHYGFYLLIGIIIFIILTGFLLKIPKIQLFVNKIIPSLPIFGKLLQYYNLANICRTLGVLLKSGINLLDAIKITTETTPNIVYRKILEKTEKSVLKGKKISSQFKNHLRYFPVLIPQMLSVGETTGNLSGSFLYLSEFYEEEVDEITKNLYTVLEPILMIFMGIIVAFVVLSIITPIYGITQNLKIR